MPFYYSFLHVLTENYGVLCFLVPSAIYLLRMEPEVQLKASVQEPNNFNCWFFVCFFLYYGFLYKKSVNMFVLEWSKCIDITHCEIGNKLALPESLQQETGKYVQ
jgi:hypothetical protein